MYSKIKIFGHPIHPMLVGFPIAFYTACTIAYIVYNGNGDVFWFKFAFVTNYAGVVMAFLTALPGFMDWFNIPKNKKAKTVGLNHLIANMAALSLFLITFFLERGKWLETKPDIGPAIILTLTGIVCTIFAGFMGWAMVQKHHIGIDTLEPEQKKIRLVK